jgi:hypothetical protein
MKRWGKGYCIPGPQCPPDHPYVGSIPYVPYPKSLWDIIFDYSEIKILEPPSGRIPPITEEQHKMYGERTPEGKMNFFGYYSEMQDWYDKLYSTYKGKENAADLAREAMAQQIEENRSSVVAQTRIVSSYGFLQTMYATAKIDVGYPEDKRPEDINIASICEFYQFKHLQNVVNGQINRLLNTPEHDWNQGFEQFYKDNVYYPLWNKRKPYSNEVLNFSTYYLPQKQVVGLP